MQIPSEYTYYRPGAFLLHVQAGMQFSPAPPLNVSTGRPVQRPRVRLLSAPILSMKFSASKVFGRAIRKRDFLISGKSLTSMSCSE